jgi:hypothetical protein
MIRRFYVNNYRCLDNFVLPVDGLKSSLLIGRNASGKSTVSAALRILQQIGRRVNRVSRLLGPRDISFGRNEVPVRLELAVVLDGLLYEYALAFELPERWPELRVLEESLTVAGEAKFSRQVAEMRFPRTDGRPDGTMPIDWHLVGLPLVQASSDSDPVHLFQQWLGRMILIEPVPALISGDSDEETFFPAGDLSNLGDWWSGLLNHSPAAYGNIDAKLRQIMPDLLDIKNPLVGRDARSLEAQFRSDSRRFRITFDMLSSGEKCMVAWALVMAANEAYGPLFCFWDEVDAHIGISEIGDMVADLRRVFDSGGQFIATSHNIETIHRFSDENTFVLHRRNHLEHTEIRLLNTLEYMDLAGALVRDELLPEAP